MDTCLVAELSKLCNHVILHKDCTLPHQVVRLKTVDIEYSARLEYLRQPKTLLNMFIER